MIDPADIRLERILWYRAPGTEKVTPHEIEPGVEYLELIVGGTVYYEVDGILQAIRYGTLFWHIPGDYTVSLTKPDDPYECIVFKFRRPTSIVRNRPRVTRFNDREKACEFGRDMLKAFHDERSDRMALTRYVYSWLEWHVHRSALREESSGIPASMQPLITLLDQRTGQDISIHEMAQICGLSTPHLHTLFKQHLGTTPHQYVLTRRLNKARHLIVSTNEPIKQVSTACGFDNIETFYRCFRKRFSISPGDFRKRNRPV